MEIKLDEIVNLEEVKGNVNLLLFNSKHFGVNDMKEVNKMMEDLKNVKITIPNI